MRCMAAVALVLLVAAGGTWAGPAPRCGRHLADLLAVVCKGRGYNNPLYHESSAPVRTRRGVVEECCKVSCTFSTLRQYCKEPDTAQAHSRPAADVAGTKYKRVRHQDLPKKGRGRQHKKKGKRGNGKCRCARRQRRRKLERARVQRKMRDASAFQIGTVVTPFLGQPVIVPHLRRSLGEGT